jgi:hypothetical protein
MAAGSHGLRVDGRRGVISADYPEMPALEGCVVWIEAEGVDAVSVRRRAAAPDTRVRAVGLGGDLESYAAGHPDVLRERIGGVTMAGIQGNFGITFRR